MPGHGGGSFGGGHGGGGFGGGPRPGGFGGPRPPYRPPHRHFFFRPRFFFGPRYYGGGCLSSLVTIVLVAVILVFSLFSGLLMPRGGDASGITASTKKRLPMDSRYITPISTYFENHVEALPIVDDILVNEKMEAFFRTTGVQPYLYVIDNLEGNRKPTTAAVYQEGLRKYGTLFGKDEGHLLVTLFLYEDYEYDFYVDLVVGDHALDSVMDEEACAILRDYLVRYLEAYESGSGSFSEAVGNAFSAAATRIMGGRSGGINPVALILVVAGVALVILLVVKLIKKEKEKKQGDPFTGHTRNGGGYY